MADNDMEARIEELQAQVDELQAAEDKRRQKQEPFGLERLRRVERKTKHPNEKEDDE